MRLAYFTICARNYFGYAKTLRRSLLNVDPDTDFFIALSDDPLVEPFSEPDVIINLSDLTIPLLTEMAFRYTIMEFATAIKPFVFRYLLEARGYDGVIYLDPDIFVVAALDHVTASLDAGADAVLTPHIRAPLPVDGKTPSTFDILNAGVFNLGFLALAKTPASEAFLNWWSQACVDHCYADLARGLFVDQKFLDFAPAFFDRIEVLKHPGYNVAYWNLPQRPLGKEADGAITAAGERLRFFHFSGVDPSRPDLLSKHQNRLSAAHMGDGAPLLTRYFEALEAEGASAYRGSRYAFGHFSDHTPIPPAARRLADQRQRRKPGELFEADHEFYNHTDHRFDHDPLAPITRLMGQTWRMRSDLAAAFPMGTARGRRGFLRWFVYHGEREGWSAPPFTAPARRSIAGRAFSLARQFRSPSE